MAFGNSRSTTFLELSTLVSEFQILAHYLGVTKLPSVINSPLRVDNNPSFGLYTRDQKRVYYVDFSTRDMGSIFQLLQELWHVSLQEVYDKIYQDLEQIKGAKLDVSSIKNTSNRCIYNKDTDVQVKVRAWKDYDLEYWGQYGISKPFLEFGDVYPMSHIIIIKNNKKIIISPDKYAYVYVEKKDGVISLKIYQPFSEDYKWFSKHDASVWDLWTKIPEKGENLIITSSRKDALTIIENCQIPTLSLQGEGYIPKEKVINILKERYKNIFILYDNDFNVSENHGRILGNKIANLFGLRQIEIPDVYQSKDPSDLCKNFDRATLKTVVNQLISKNLNNNF